MTIIFYIIILAFLLLILYFFQRAIIQYFSLISYLLFGSNGIGIYFYFLFFLPGVIFHELAHLFTASILGVPTGEMTIFPRKTNSADNRQDWLLGEVKSAETDPLRSNLIGLAPMIVGITSLIVICRMGFGIINPSDLMILPVKLVAEQAIRQNILFLYLIIVFSNTMFLSKEDRHYIWAIPSLLVILIGLTQISGLLPALNYYGQQIVTILTLSFFLTIVIDGIFLLPLFLLSLVLIRLRK